MRTRSDPERIGSRPKSLAKFQDVHSHLFSCLLLDLERVDHFRFLSQPCQYNFALFDSYRIVMPIVSEYVRALWIFFTKEFALHIFWRHFVQFFPVARSKLPGANIHSRTPEVQIATCAPLHFCRAN